MSIHYEVLGEPGRDNALLVRIDSGQAVERLLFDCGERCLDTVTPADVQAIDDLFFSHLHMDHVGGFDAYFRRNYNRASRPNRVWGPPGTSRIMQHRFQGFMWNLHEGMAAAWTVRDLHLAQGHLSTVRSELGEAFAVAHGEGDCPVTGPFHEGIGCTVEALEMDHLTPVLAYLVRERPRLNVDAARLAELGLPAGPWLGQVKQPSTDGPDTVAIGGSEYSLAELRDRLLVETAGDSIAYLTDFLLDEPAVLRLVPFLHGCTTLVCEAQYRQADAALAERNYHMTAAGAAELARRAGAGELVLFHLSDRYRPPEWLEMLAEARAVFPNTRFPERWALGE